MHFDSALTDVNEDKLGRKEFAVQIANGLVNSFKDNHESIVIGINGEWGSGKSTLVNFIVQEIENLTKKDEYKPVIIRFNPWMFSGQKELQNIFLDELFKEFNLLASKIKNMAEKIEPILNHLTFIKYFHSGLGKALEDGQKVLKDFNKKGDINHLKKDIDQSIKLAGLKIYITIDDIDRLNPTEITEILQMVKLNANFANTVFILCYDYDVVVSALKNKFGENGEKYLEKIVQVDYTLPHILKDKIKEIFIEEIGKLFDNEELNKELKEFVENDELILPFFSTLRDMNRFLNAIKLRLEFIHEEVNVGDFLLIETLRVFDKKAYQFVINNKDILTINESIKEKNKILEQLPNKLKIDTFTINIVDYCFYINPISTTFGGMDAEPIMQEERKKSIGNRYYFDRYFTLQISKDILEKDFQVFVNANTNNKVKTLEKWYEEEALSTFFRVYKKRIIASVEDQNNIDILESILLFTDKNLEYVRTDLLYESYYSIVIIEYLVILKEISYETATLFLETKLFDKMTNHFIFFLELTKIIEGYDRYKENKDSSYKFVYARQDEEKNNNLVIRAKVRASEICKHLIDVSDLSNISKDKIQRIIVYAVMYNQKEIISLLLNLFYKNESNFLFMTNCVVSLSYYYTTFYGGTTWGYRLSKEDFTWLNLDKAVEYAKNIEITNIENEDFRNTLKLFLKMHEDGFDKNIYYDFNTQEDITDKLIR